MLFYVNIVLILIVIGIIGYPFVNKFRIKSVAKLVDNAEFSKQMIGGQLIDLREANDFRVAHILGARNLPFSTLDQSLSAIRKDKPILFYENAKPAVAIRAALKLKKAGYINIFILKTGMKTWHGKIKKGA
ncbi:NADH dehydrogenase [Lactococcus hodotermopsidis]|uniref:NADH dehydrogenase n=1 Tax=Pseudolactococcus hodotermopsidis TaxID=2709157 RepID=A0A6A0BFG8_9LACT|nr:rhodanese-like domain-containing protein [Lactococcus hodotermopsidis]GFH43224.1 NADH dehydrogenase [Lactococcus hodotermopsidis]